LRTPLHTALLSFPPRRSSDLGRRRSLRGPPYTSAPAPAAESRFQPMTGPTFQELIARLDAYWAAQGCVLVQPLDLEVGAGTFHPATFLRAIGPEPWNAAYVQP